MYDGPEDEWWYNLRTGESVADEPEDVDGPIPSVQDGSDEQMAYLAALEAEAGAAADDTGAAADDAEAAADDGDGDAAPVAPGGADPHMYEDED